MKWTNTIASILCVCFLQGQRIMSFPELLDQKIQKPGYFILKGEPSCHDCYQEVFNFLRSQKIPGDQIYFLSILPEDNLLRRNEMHSIQEEFAISPEQICFLDRDTWKTAEAPWYPKLLIINEQYSIFQLSYPELFGKNKLRRKRLRKLLEKQLPIQLNEDASYKMEPAN
ncbi:MAG: hypothetical protein EP338_01570 [Bacteroidetes bacterium]|nr:MAG: hypothetical protein EP338_01570 [Bacteroidota bacterium]